MFIKKTLLITFIFCSILYSQEKFKIIEKEVYTNCIYFNIFSVGKNFSPQSSLNYDFFLFRYKYYNLGLFSSIDIKNRTLNYYFPFGFYYPLKLGNFNFKNIPYAIGLNSNFFLITNSPLTEFHENPKVFELSLNFDTFLLSLSTGYRFQIGKWTKESFDKENNILYASEIGRLDGFFIKASFGLSAVLFDKKNKTEKIRLPEPSLSLNTNITDNNRIKVGIKKNIEVIIKNEGEGLAENLNLQIDISDNYEPIFSFNRNLGNLEKQSTKGLLVPVEINSNLINEKLCKLKIRCYEKDGFYSTLVQDITIIPNLSFKNDNIIKEEFIYVIANVSNIRTGPSTNQDILFQVSYGDKLAILENINLWLKIRDVNSSREGWIYSKLISPVMPPRKIYKKKTIKSKTLKEYYGKYMNYKYTFGFINNSYIIIFSPFLPRNDLIVKGAMLDVINKIYGKHRIVNLNPKITKRNGINYIFFEGITYNYLFLIIKEDTGEVNSFSLSREKR